MEFNNNVRTAAHNLPFDFIFNQNSTRNDSKMGDEMVQEYVLDLLRNIPSGIIAYNEKSEIIISNQNAIQYLGLKMTQEQLLNKSILDVINNLKLKKTILRSNESGMAPFEIPLLFINGRYFQVFAKNFKTGILLVVQDITINNKIKNEATKSLLLGQEIERKRIASEIHDGIGPVISTIKLRLDAIQRKANDENIKNSLKIVNEMISDIAKEIRAISHSLMPSSLIDFGLSDAISNMVNQLFKSEVTIKFKHNINEQRFDPQLELHIYRIVQELINNGIKHADGLNCEVTILNHSDFIEIRYQDQGNGFDLDQPRKGIGLSNIKNRVQILGGQINLRSSIGAGVLILINIPNKIDLND